MLEVLLGLIIGLMVGTIVAFALMREVLRRYYEARLKAWIARHEEEIRREAVKASSSILKGKIGEQMAPLFPEFGYNPADARFIGGPVDYVVFNGYSDILSGRADRPIEVVFLEVKTGRKAKLTLAQEKIKEAVEKGRVKWRTLELR